ncbi:putative U3 small nucleolar RNA-associated protein 13 [Blattamonas nauphoetae]|uniref:U3 small nucleolar RNA-associated protein 13 n=1 Tax=Blattamonas nauphoetae TaxID=2049346 RepID=A0ABQ9X9R6_9EUKA|nr:putative U3 small nucleolar RNA-associated protein 13 [Blattamonas nauphoetae]
MNDRSEIPSQQENGEIISETLKTKFRQTVSLSPFYDNGPVAQWENYIYLAEDTHVNMIDLETGALVRTFEVNTLITTLTAFKEVSKPKKGTIRDTGSVILVVASVDSSVTIFNVDTGETIKKRKLHSQPVLSLSFHPTGAFLATSSADCSILVWDITDLQLTHSFKNHTEIVSLVRFHPDPSKFILVSCSNDRTVRVFDLLERKCIHLFEGFQSPVVSLEFHQTKGGSIISTASNDGTISQWSLSTGKLLRTQPFGHAIEAIMGYTPDPPADVVCSNPFLFCGTPDGVFLLHTSDLKLTPQQYSASVLHLLPLNLDRTTGQFESLLVVTDDQTLIQLDPDTLAPRSFRSANIGEVISAKFIQSNPHFIPPSLLSALNLTHPFTPSSSLSVAVASNCNELRLFSLSTQHFTPLFGHSNFVMSVDVSKDGNWILTASKDKTVRLWGRTWRRMSEEEERLSSFDSARWNRWQCIAIGKGHAQSVLSCSFSKKLFKFSVKAKVPVLSKKGKAKSGKKEEVEVPFLVPQFAISGSEDRTIKKWDVFAAIRRALQKQVKAFVNDHFDGPSPQNEAKNEDDGEEEQNAEENEMVCLSTIVAHTKDVNVCAVSPNDAIVATGSQDKDIKLWSFSSTQTSVFSVSTTSSFFAPISTLKGHRRGIWALSFSHIDRLLASASGDSTIRVWNLADYSCLRVLEGHSGAVLNVAFLPPPVVEEKGGSEVCRELVSSGGDGTVRVWSVGTGECLSTFDETHDDRIWSLDTIQVESERDEDEGDELTEQRVKSQLKIVSGAADGTIKLFDDVTAAFRMDQIRAKEENMQQQQMLQNAINQGKLDYAFNLSVELGQPKKLYDSIDAILKTSDGQPRLLSLTAALQPPALSLCLRWVSEWNTNTHYSSIAQFFLSTILNCFPPSVLVTIPSAKVAIQSLIPYTERHYQRINRMMTEAQIYPVVAEKMKFGYSSPINLDLDDEED